MPRMSYWSFSEVQMKTIKQLIADRYAYGRAIREIRREERTDEVYSKFPALKAMDDELIAIRSKRMIAAIDHDNVAQKICESDEHQLLARREEFIKEHRIDPGFDKEMPVCAECGDTGFVRMSKGYDRVCDCMKDLVVECFDSCGLKDYASYSNTALDMDMFGDKEHRKEVRKRLTSAIIEPDRLGMPLLLYVDKVRSGKTFLAVCMVKTAILLGKSAAYQKCDELRSLSAQDLRFVSDCEFLVLDDYSGAVTHKADNASALNNILESRMAKRLPTVIVSSSSKEVLVEESDVRIAGKLNKADLV